MLYYFAYGSNMYHARLQARVPSARPMGTAVLDGYRLVVHKKSNDGSLKCDLVAAEDTQAYGVLFEMKASELPLLDKAEGVGFGYVRVERTLLYKEEAQQAFLYLAQPAYIESKGLPYDWYMQFVLQGAIQNQLPAFYIREIEKIQHKADMNQERAQKNAEILRR